jgi:hypothetical protein
MLPATRYSRGQRVNLFRGLLDLPGDHQTQRSI